jgi:hypothetical protein
MSHGTATSFDSGFCCGLRLGHGDARSGEGEHGEQYIRDARGSVGYWRSYCEPVMRPFPPTGRSRRSFACVAYAGFLAAFDRCSLCGVVSCIVERLSGS